MLIKSLASIMVNLVAGTAILATHSYNAPTTNDQNPNARVLEA